MYFQYGEKETEYLKNKCQKMAFAINKIGKIERETNKDLFSSIVNTIIGQQISSKALETVWQRFKSGLQSVDADSVLSTGIEKLQSFGISYKKAEYIFDFATKVKQNKINLESLWVKDDDEIIKELTSLKGIGVWTAEMLMLFCMERKNILSYNDFGIQKGLRMLYHHRKITKTLFKKYQKRFSPYCSVASLYLWEIAGGRIVELKDLAPIKKKKPN